MNLSTKPLAGLALFMILFLLLASAGLAQNESDAGTQNIALCYDQAIMPDVWYKFVSTTNDFQDIKYSTAVTVPLLYRDPFLVKVSDQILDTFMGTTRAEQSVFFNSTNRPFILNWPPDYLSFYKANNNLYGKPQDEQLAGITPPANYWNQGQSDEFEKKKVAQRQKEIIYDFWKKARPVLPDSEVALVGRCRPLEYDFDKHIRPFGIFEEVANHSSVSPEFIRNKDGGRVYFGDFPVEYNVSPLSPLKEIVVYTFNGQTELPAGFPINEDDAHKMLAQIRDDTRGSMNLYYVFHGRLRLDPSIYETVKCQFLSGYLSKPGSYNEALWKMYVFDIKSVDFYEFKEMKRKLIKVLTLDGSNYQSAKSKN